MQKNCAKHLVSISIQKENSMFEQLIQEGYYIMEVPKLAQEVFNVFGVGENSNGPLEAVRLEIIGRNWLNFWALSQEEYEFIKFHNNYVNQF